MESVTKNKVKPKLNRSLFWDVNFKDIDFDKHSRFVIERVVTRGNLTDWNSIQMYYGVERIKSEVVKIRYLDERTLNFLSLMLKLTKEEFRCFNTEPSIKALWNY